MAIQSEVNINKQIPLMAAYLPTFGFIFCHTTFFHPEAADPYSQMKGIIPYEHFILLLENFYGRLPATD